MKVVLIRPPAAAQRSTVTAGALIPPLGLAYVASSLEGAGHEVDVIDAVGEGIDQFRKIASLDIVITGLSVDEIIGRVRADVELIGVSCMFSAEWFYDQPLIQRLRRAFPRARIVVGGEHVTADWRNLLRTTPEVDYCVIGEGEATVVQLAERLARGESAEGIDGLAYRQGDFPVRTAPRKRMGRLDDLPWPAWEKFPVANYHRAGFAMTTINRRAMPVLASRGCPFSCKFCSAPQMWGNELLLRDPAQVIEEIKFYVKRYGIEHVDFLDIVGVLNRKWTVELLKGLIREDLPITWLHGAGTRSEILDEEMLGLFRDSKALRVHYAPESGSKATIKRIAKRVDLEKLIGSMKMANLYGISMRAPLLFGFPGQTMKEAWENVWFGMRMIAVGVDDVVAHAFSPYPGSVLHRELTEGKQIDLDQLLNEGKYNDFLRSAVVTSIWGQASWSEHIPNYCLPIFQYGTMLAGYGLRLVLRPWRAFTTLKRVFVQRKPITLFDNIIYRMFFGARTKAKFRDLPEDDFSSVPGQQAKAALQGLPQGEESVHLAGVPDHATRAQIELPQRLGT